MRRHLSSAAILAVLTLTLMGCGESASSQIRDKVQELVQAAASRDYATICRDVLAPSLVARLSATGLTCERAMHLALAPVHHPVVSVGRVIIRGSHAWALTLTSAQGQRASLSAVKLQMTSQGWRIVKLSSPISAALRR